MSYADPSGQHEEGEEVDSENNTTTETRTDTTQASPSPSPDSRDIESSSQQKRRRYGDEEQEVRRDRPDREDEQSTRNTRRNYTDTDTDNTATNNMESEDNTTNSGGQTGEAGEGGSTNNHKDEKTSSSVSASSSSASSPDQEELRLLLESNHVGAIIGKGGENIKKLREDFQCYINILKGSENHQIKERIMLLKGAHTQVLKTLAAIIDAQLEAAARREREMQQRGDEATDRPRESQIASLKLLVHRTTVGAVIGKAGDTIRSTSSTTGARIQVSADTMPNSTEKSVSISGTKEQVLAALDKVIEQCKTNPPKLGTKLIPYVPSVYITSGSVYGGYGGSSYDQRGGDSRDRSYDRGGGYSSGPPAPYGGSNEGPLTEQKIAIPSVCAGCVIGKGGAIIRDLRTQSNCLINVEKPDAAVPNERVVTIKGTTQNIQTAVYLIRQCVEQYKPREGDREREAERERDRDRDYDRDYRDRDRDRGRGRDEY